MIGVLTSATVGSELVRGRSTSVTVPTDHVGATLTLTPAGVTHGAEGALRITLAFWEMESNTGDTLKTTNKLQQILCGRVTMTDLRAMSEECEEEEETSRVLFRRSRIKHGHHSDITPRLTRAGKKEEGSSFE